MTEVSNKFLSIELWTPFVLMAIGGLMGYGALSADVKHKADRSDVEVLKSEVIRIQDDVEEISAEQKEQRHILEEIRRAVVQDAAEED